MSGSFCAQFENLAVLLLRGAAQPNAAVPRRRLHARDRRPRAQPYPG